MIERKTYFINKYNYGEGVVGFDEYVISLGTNCSLGCEYCYLKFSKTPQTPIIYQNLNKLEEELERLFLSKKEKIFYFNLGETTDSFLTKKHFETLIEISKIIDELAKKYKKFCFVELRTKTNNILKFNKKFNFENLKLIYGISLSAQEVIDEFEKNTASFKERIDSLIFAEKLGFLVAVMLEPIIIYPVVGITYQNVVDSVKNVIENYKKIIKETFEKINFEKLYSINLSCLRLTKRQFKVLKEKKSKLCFFEMFLCDDGKFRYSRPIRVTIYSELINFIKFLFPDIYKKIFLSFEFDYIWRACGLKIFDDFFHFFF